MPHAEEQCISANLHPAIILPGRQEAAAKTERLRREMRSYRQLAYHQTGSQLNPKGRSRLTVNFD